MSDVGENLDKEIRKDKPAVADADERKSKMDEVLKSIKDKNPFKKTDNNAAVR